MSLPGLQSVSQGYGPLLRRDYWAVIRDCRLRPREVLDLVASRFPEFAPAALCRFSRCEADGRPGLHPGDVLNIRIRLAPVCQVRVLQRSANSLTLGTMAGHPEAGKITFGAYRNERGDVIFHIRSHARARGRGIYMGFLAMGEAMQTNTWTDFVNGVALTAGRGPLHVIHAETTVLTGQEAERIESEPDSAPTFAAEGD